MPHYKARQRAAGQVLSSSKLSHLRVCASIKMRLLLPRTIFCTTPFSQPLATLQKSGSNRQVRELSGKAGVDRSALALFDLVHRRLHA